MTSFPRELQEFVANLPEKPGVYLFRDAESEVIYVGKAKNLRRRVSSYFRPGSDDRPFIAFLPQVLHSIDFVVLNSEKEALILENELIKQHHPRYNILLRDDKNFLYVRVGTGDEWPGISLVRRRAADGARYFGPFHSAASARQTFAALQRYFGLRTCTDYEMRTRSRPCLEADMGRCIAPCVNKDRATYQAAVQDALRFLSGRGTDVIADLERRMYEASDALNFERAAVLRDRIVKIREGMQKQYVVGESLGNVDAVGLASQGRHFVVVVLRFDSGRLHDRAKYVFESPLSDKAEVVESFVVQFYQHNEVPAEVLVPEGVDGRGLGDVLAQRTRGTVKVRHPRGGRPGVLLRMARENAREVLRLAMVEQGMRSQALQRVMEITGLDREPKVIAGFDMSMLQGSNPVGALVVFRDGRPFKRGYRTFSIKSGAIDDFHQMQEVLTRFLKRVGQGDLERPDLVLLDGGPPQLGAYEEASKETGVSLFVIGLAKSRVVEHESGRRSPERLYVPDGKGWRRVVPDQHDDGLRLLMQVRDEAHRFAGRFQGARRQKSTFRSLLESIPGVGKKRRLAILRHFKDMDALRKAGIHELMAIPGIPESVARRIFETLHEE